MPGGASGVRTRPRDRKDRIVAAAADRFGRLGYHAVTMSAIAADVGITAGALYRHFRGKADLFQRVIDDRLDRTEDALASGERLGEVLPACARVALTVRGLGVLWRRDAQNLPTDRLAVVRRRGGGQAARLAGLIRRDRADLSGADAELLAWAAFAVLTGPGNDRAPTPPGGVAGVLATVAADVCAATLPQGPVPDRGGADPLAAAPEAARPERIVAAADRLFGARGYRAVTMEEIGAAAGIAGPSVYRHFPAKRDLLVAVLRRGGDRLGADVASPAGDDPAGELAAAVRTYAAVARGHPYILGALVTEVPYLPDGPRREIRRLQRRYVAGWADRLTALGVDPAEARIRTHAALAIVDDLVGSSRLRDRPDLERVLTTLAWAALVGHAGRTG